MSKKHNITIGMFGTCGCSKWREKFINAYEEGMINYYNPQLPEGIEWKEEFADLEAEHLASDEIILFPITAETYGLGSLNESGFSAMGAININRNRQFVFMIDSFLEDSLNDASLRETSIRSRALVRAHIKHLDMQNVYFVNSLDEMLEVSLKLYEIEKLKNNISIYSTKNKITMRR